MRQEHKVSESKPFIRIWAVLSAIAFILMGFHYWMVGAGVLILSFASLVIYNIIASRNSSSVTSESRTGPFWKKFLFDLAGVLSILGLGVWVIPLFLVVYGRLLPLWIVWAGGVLAIPFAVLVQWRVSHRAIDRFVVLQTAYVVISITLMASLLYLLPEKVRKDEQSLSWIVALVAVSCCYVIPYLGYWLKSRFFLPKK